MSEGREGHRSEERVGGCGKRGCVRKSQGGGGVHALRSRIIVQTGTVCQVNGEVIPLSVSRPHRLLLHRRELRRWLRRRWLHRWRCCPQLLQLLQHSSLELLLLLLHLLKLLPQLSWLGLLGWQGWQGSGRRTRQQRQRAQRRPGPAAQGPGACSAPCAAETASSAPA